MYLHLEGDTKPAWLQSEFSGPQCEFAPAELWLKPTHCQSGASWHYREGRDEARVEGPEEGATPLPSIPHDLTGPGEYIRQKQRHH